MQFSIHDMVYKIFETNQYIKAFKKAAKRNNFNKLRLEEVIDNLANGEILDISFRDHELQGNMKGLRECHISSDLLLVYKKEKQRLILFLSDLGSHSELFG